MLPKLNSAHGSETRNIINRAIDSINVQGKSIQDLVAEGQLTEDQYAELIKSVNDLVSKGEITLSDVDKNSFKLDGTWFSSEFIRDLNDGVINTTNVLPKTIGKKELIDRSVEPRKLTHLKKTKNLFNGYDEIMLMHLTAGHVYSSDTGSRDPRTAVVPIEPGETYTVTVYGEKTSFRIFILNNAPILDGENHEADQVVLETNSVDKHTFTNTDSGRFLLVYVGGNGLEPKMQVEKGSDSTAYVEPYYIPIEMIDSELTDVKDIAEILENKLDIMTELNEFNATVEENGQATRSTNYLNWEIGTLDSSAGEPLALSYRARTSDFYVPGTYDKEIIAYPGYLFLIYKFELDGTFVERISATLVDAYTIEKGYKYKFVVGATDNKIFEEVPLNTLYIQGEKSSGGHIPSKLIYELPNPPSASFAFVRPSQFEKDNKYSGLTYSDGIVWRWMEDNKPTISATGYATVKASDSTLIAGDEVDVIDWSASVTKTLSSLTAVENVADLTEKITIIEEDVVISTMDNRVAPGDTPTFRQLIASAMIQSDNNASNALARTIGYKLNPDATSITEAKQAFYDAMEQTALSIGMNNTESFGPAYDGLRTTPLDLCTLGIHIYNNVPEIADVWGLLEYQTDVTGSNPRTLIISSSTSPNGREIIPEFIGGKTGTSHFGAYLFMWEHKETKEVYATAILNTNIYNMERFINSRRIIDEVYSIEYNG